jgi:hypothetical protein
VEVDPAVHSRDIMMQEDIGVCMGIQNLNLVEHGDLRGERSSPLQQHMDLGDYLLSSINHMSDDRGSVIDHQYVESPTDVHDGMRIVWSPSDYSPWVSVDEFLVKPLGLTNAYDILQSYMQLQLFLLAFPDTYIIYSNIGEDMQLHGTWRVVRQRPPNRGYFIICSRIREVHPRQSDEALGMMESILSCGTKDIPEVDIGSESQRDEDEEQSRTDVYDEDYEVSWQDVWSQQAASEILRTIHDVPMVG